MCVILQDMPDCAYTIGSYGQILISCTIPSGSLCQTSRIQSYTLSVLICCVHLLCDWSFRLYHHITYICCFVASYLFLLWSDWFYWNCCFAANGGDSVYHLRFPSRSHVHVFSCKMCISRLKRPYSCFSSIFFSCYCRSVGPHVVSIVSGGCNQSSSELFLMLFSSHCIGWYVNTIFNAGKFSSSSCSWYIKSINVISGMYCLMHGHQISCSLVYLFKFFSGPLQKVPRISYKGDNPGIYSFDKVPAI